VAAKCRFFIVKHKWTNNRWKIIKTANHNVSLS
jgi:hypothetical protein